MVGYSQTEELNLCIYGVEGKHFGKQVTKYDRSFVCKRYNLIDKPELLIDGVQIKLSKRETIDTNTA